MRSVLILACSALLIVPIACSDDGGDFSMKAQCNDGEDNDADGMVDFPDDLGCTGAADESEDSMPSPQCKDGRDNDDDGKADFPTDPGCFAPQQDDETDDCPDGPSCPQCSDGMDNDMNGTTDYPSDTGGCMAASDTDEYTQNPAACGPTVTIKKLPYDGKAMGMLDNTAMSKLVSPMCGGAAAEDVYELRVFSPKVVVATTDTVGTAANTILYIRGANCADNASELACNDDTTTTNNKSTVTKSLSTPGTYYLVVDSKDSTSGGSYELNVKFLTGEGETCMGLDDCGPGLVCRIPFGQTVKVCSKHICEDTLDDDQDGKNGYPMDPGCSSPQDDDESDTCPNGVGCPECGDTRDNDGDGMIDYGQDATCKSAGDASEACISSEGVTPITTAMVMGDTTNATNDSKPTCSSSSAMAPDLMYRLDLPAMASLSLNTTGFDTATALYNSTCGGTAIACSDPALMTVTNLAAGTYYFLVDGWYTSKGPFTIAVSGKIQNGGLCEGPLAQSGAIACNTGYACKGTTGSKTCQPAMCSDGLDNDGDTKIDFPFDPGCADGADDTEANPAILPACSNGTDDDTDGTTDFPADYGCVAAGGTTEAFCTGEMDPTSLITTKTVTGTTMGKSNDWMPSCSSSSAPDVAHALQLPVPVATLVIDTIGSGFDTILSVRSLQCTTSLFCDDDSGGTANTSKITMSNVAAGGYAVIVDGYTSNNGAYTLNIQGTVAPQTPCSSPLFSGANAVLKCPTGTTCTGTPAKCM